MNKFIFDTDIIIAYLRNHQPSVKFIDDFLNQNKEIYLSVITEAELYAGKSTRINEKKIEIILHLARYQIIELDRKTAKLAGEIRRDCDVLLVDALIAATAILNHCTLVTRNIKHFAKIPKLKVLKP